MNKNVLLLTASIDPIIFNTPFTILTDKNERLKQYSSATNWFLRQEYVDSVILCDNTLSEESFEQSKRIATNLGKDFEFLTFLGNKDKIKNLGKGYGEGEIIKYALKNSSIINTGIECFYKVTGRIIIKNINEIIKYTNDQNCFLLASCLERDAIDTRFFKSSVKFYKDNLEDGYEICNDFNNFYLEKVFYIKLKHCKRGHFSSYPKFIGVSGSDGTSYEKSFLKHNIMNIVNWLGYC